MTSKTRILLALLVCCAALTLAAALLLPESPDAVFPAEWDGNPASLGLLLEEEADGLLVIAVWEDSPAQRAGTEPGDRLTALNGNSFASLSDLDAMLLTCTPATGVTFTALRSGTPLQLSLIPPP